MNASRKAFLELHIAVFLFGFTAILGKLIQLPALALVWWRVVLTCLSLLLFLRGDHALRHLPKGMVVRLLAIGALVALHWLCFYQAIKWSNSSITLVCMATTSFFTAMIEPLLLRRPFRGYELALGVFIVPGMVLIVRQTDLSMQAGVWAGLMAAVLAALFASLNKKIVDRVDPIALTFVELGSVVIVTSALLPVYDFSGSHFWPAPMDWLYLLVLSLLCTTLAYVLSITSLRHMSAFASTFIINLEPVYGIGMAWVLLHEDKDLSPQFYWGVLLILVAVFSYPYIRNHFEKRNTRMVSRSGQP